MIIFDLDGTLWNTTETTFEAAQSISKEYEDVGIITIEQVKNGMGLSTEENMKNFMPHLDDKRALFYLEKMNEKNMQIISERGAMLYEGVAETIQKLSKEYHLGIVTNNNNQYAETFLKISKLKKFFADYMGAASFHMTKAEAIQNMVRRNNELNSIYVGDIKKDMVAAEIAGITFIHAKYGFEPTLISQYFINDMTELEEVVKKIYNKE